jgi:hypothetical protein
MYEKQKQTWANSCTSAELKLLAESHGYSPKQKQTKLDIVNWLVSQGVERQNGKSNKRKSDGINPTIPKLKKVPKKNINTLIENIKKGLGEPLSIKVVKKDDVKIFDDDIVMNNHNVVVGELKNGTLTKLSEDGITRCVNERIPFSILHIEGKSNDNLDKFTIDELGEEEEEDGEMC